MSSTRKVLVLAAVGVALIVSLALCFGVGIFIGASTGSTTAFNPLVQRPASNLTPLETITPTSVDTTATIDARSPTVGNGSIPSLRPTLAALPLPNPEGGSRGGTTTQPSIPAAAPFPNAANKTTTVHSIAWVGCSNSWQSVVGYHATPGNQNLFWDTARYNTGGDRVDQWAISIFPAWRLFDIQVQHYGQPSEVWVQLCERYDTNPSTYAQVRSIFSILKNHAPNATYYLSAINIYNPTNICSFMGPSGQGETDTLAWRDQAVAEGLALRGPDMGPLDATNTNGGLCHPNDAGELLLGRELKDFFDP